MRANCISCGMNFCLIHAASYTGVSVAVGVDRICGCICVSSLTDQSLNVKRSKLHHILFEFLIESNIYLEFLFEIDSSELMLIVVSIF